MLMNVLACALLFLFIGPFKHVSSAETKEAGVSSSQLKEVYIAVNNTLELNCSINATVHNIHPTQLGWKHKALTLVNFTRIVNNSTIQLRKNHTQYDDAGVYECGLNDSSKFQSLQKIVVIVGEKPKTISIEQLNVLVYGKPVQEVIVKWPTLQANVTNELLLGRAPPGQYFCKFNNITQCRRTPEFQYEPLSCHIGMDVLGKLFNRSELLKSTCSAHPLFRCDVICVKVLVKNSFGASESDPAKLNLLHQARCPSLGKLTVSLDGHHLTASWQRPPIIGRINYVVTYDITSLLTGKTSRDKQSVYRVTNPNCTVCAWSIDRTIVPFARYTFSATCNFDFHEGPAVHTQVITKEAAPSEAPYWCEMKNRSRHEALVSWKVPSIGTWNGKPNKFLVYYGDQRIVVNTSLAELLPRNNKSASVGVPLKNLEPGKNYTARVAMCTGGGCGNWSEPCSIRDSTESDPIVKVVPGPDKTNRGDNIWLPIAIGALVGIILVAFIVRLKWRRRSQRKERPPLSSVLNPLTGFHPYDSPIDESLSFSEDDQFYDIIEPTIQRPLLANVDGPVVNLPVTYI